jgi:hypothetical protein
MNDEILGSMESKGQWKMPIETQQEENMKVGTINIENYRGCKIMENFGSLVDKCIVETKKRRKWTCAVNNYNSAMVILCKKTSYLMDQIFKVQLLMDCAYLVHSSRYG